jgi:hypothetical protein
MTDLTFNDPEEAAAWDAIVTELVGCYERPEDVLSRADAMILERRKRMAPEKVGLSEGQIEDLKSFKQLWDRLLP